MFSSNLPSGSLKDNHIPQLDGLRFFAIVSVMIAHWLQWRLYNPFLQKFPFGGGVILFYVLSGFLITRILLTYKKDSSNTQHAHFLKNFYIRRFLRIFPIYYGLLILLYMMDYENTRVLSPWLFSYSVNIYQSIYNEYIGCYSHFWSLSVEEQFYIFWPLLIIFINPRHFFKAIVATIVLSLLSRYIVSVTTANWMAVAYFPTSCMSFLALGALLAYFDLHRPEIFKKIAQPLIAYSGIMICVLLLFLIRYTESMKTKEMFDDFLIAVLSVFVVARASINGFQFLPKWILEHKFVVYSGKISYGLYVYHMFAPPLYYYLIPKIGLVVNNRFTECILCYFITFVVAHFSWIIIEKPINSLKRKFPYEKKSVTGT